MIVSNGFVETSLPNNKKKHGVHRWLVAFAICYMCMILLFRFYSPVNKNEIKNFSKKLTGGGFSKIHRFLFLTNSKALDFDWVERGV